MIALSSFVLFVSLLVSPSISWDASDHDHNHKCLTKEDATSIINKYYAIWESRDMTTITKLVNDFATDSVTREDETINFGLGPCVIGPDGPYAPNKQVWLLTLQARLAETTIENKWQGSAIDIGGNPNFTANAGDSVRWKGIEMMEVDTASMKVTQIVSSADWFWYEYDIGAKIVFQKYHFPACLCQDSVPGLDSKGQCIAKQG